jgi:hypothetical protein
VSVTPKGKDFVVIEKEARGWRVGATEEES